MILVGDIGGTNARFGVFDPKTEQVSDIVTRRNDDFALFNNLLEDVLEKNFGTFLHTIQAIHLAIAGKVTGQRAILSNRESFVFGTEELGTVFAKSANRNVPIVLMNDFQAQAFALPFLPDSSLTPLKPGNRAASGPFLILGPGTGLGMGFLVSKYDGSFQSVHCEGGFWPLPVRDKTDFDLRARLEAYAAERAVDAEYALAGQGIARVYSAICERDTVTSYQSAQITQMAASGEDPAAKETVLQVSKWLWRVAAEMTQVLRPYGGVYFAGGISAVLLPYLSDPAIQAEFFADQRILELSDVPVFHISDGMSALLGAAHFTT